MTLASTSMKRIRLSWEDYVLTLRHPRLPGGKLEINYLEAHCRAHSSNRPWPETVIRQQPYIQSPDSTEHELKLVSTLSDGVVLRHHIIADSDVVHFNVALENRTRMASELHWAQPCVKVGDFTGMAQQPDPYDYLQKCFVMIDGKVTRLPTQPWATKALYTPGQVWRQPHIPADDVNPRPLSSLHPSAGLIGCFSGDESLVLATAWEPYQELFQGIYQCIHADFRVGGLNAGEQKTARGKLYIMSNDIDALLRRYANDFTEHYYQSPGKSARFGSE